MDSSNQPAGRLPDTLPRGSDRNIPRSSTETTRSGNRDPSTQRHGVVGSGSGTQFADPHRNVRSRTRSRTRPLRSRSRLDLQQRTRENRQTIPRTKPGTSAGERQSRVRETAAVRTYSQVAASAAAGAAIGSMIPVGGTAVGLAVGVVVGLGMSIDTGEGKTVGDRNADLGEGIWNWGKGLFGR